MKRGVVKLDQSTGEWAREASLRQGEQDLLLSRLLPRDRNN